MKRLVLLGLFLSLLLSGCNINLGIGNVKEKYRFKDYDEFVAIIEEVSDDDDYFVVERIEYAEDVNTVDLGLVFEDVTIISENRDDIKIQYFGVFKSKSDKQPEFKVETKNTFKFHVKWKNFNGSAHAKVIVYVPDTYDDKMIIDTVSGDIEISKNDFEALSVDTVSGDIALDNLEIDKLDVDTVSGDLEFKTGRIDSLVVNTVSGDIDVVDVDLVELNFDTVSGDLELYAEECKGDISVDSVSGDIDIKFSGDVNTEIDIDTTSGDIDVDYTLNDVETKKDSRLIAKIGSGKYDMNIDTVSGDVKIH